MPEPTSNETRQQFISRCIPDVIAKGTAQDTKQAVAICSSFWEQDKRKKK